MEKWEKSLLCSFRGQQRDQPISELDVYEVQCIIEIIYVCSVSLKAIGRGIGSL